MNNIVYLPNNQWATYTNGIVVQNSRNVLVQRNYIEGTGTHWWKSGIRLDKCPGSTVRCNTSSNLGVGLFMTDEQVPVSLKQNEMINNWTGLYLGGGNVGHIGLPQGWYVANWIQNNGAYLPLLAYSASTLAWDNHWVGPFDNGIPGDDAFSANVISSMYTIFAQNGNPEWKPTPSDNSLLTGSPFALSSLVANNYLGNLNGENCSDLEGLVWQGGNINQLKFMLSDTVVQTYNESYHWSQKYTIYDFLTQTDSLRSSDSVFIQFYDSVSVSNIGLLNKITNGLGNIKGKGIVKGDIALWKDTLSGITPDNEPETDLVQTLNLWADFLLGSTDSIQIDSGFNTIEDMNSLLDLVSTYTKLDSSSYELVKEIANKCPYRYGNAVYFARGLAALNDSSGVVYQNNCETYVFDSTIYRMEDPTQSLLQSINKLYPNPASNTITLEYSLSEGEEGTIQLFNPIGQLEFVQERILGKGVLDIEIYGLPAGIYQARLIVNDQKNCFWKVCILKN